MQVEARMTHGELGDLREQWTQLQQSLAAQGIRLGALQQTPAPVSVAPEMTPVRAAADIAARPAPPVAVMSKDNFMTCSLTNG